MHYDVIYCPFPINSQYLKMWRVDNPVVNKLWGEGKKFWKKLKRQIHVLKMNETIIKFTSYTEQHLSGLCCSRAWWPLGPNFSPLVTRKSQIFYSNHMPESLQFQSTGLPLIFVRAQPWSVQFILGKRNQTKTHSNSIEPNRLDCGLIGAVTEYNHTGTFQWVWLPNSIEPIRWN